MDRVTTPLTPRELATLDRLEADLATRDPHLVARFDRLSANKRGAELYEAWSLSSVVICVILAVATAFATLSFMQLAAALSTSATTARP
jgi:hypothetical protein